MNVRNELWGIYAPKDSVVLYALESSSEYGIRLYLAELDKFGRETGYRCLLGHHEENLVTAGQLVKKNDLLAIMGNTGHGYPKPNKHGHFGLIPPGRPLEHLKVNCINPVNWLVDGGAWPYNTKVSGGYEASYGGGFDKEDLHEGLDASGLDANVIKNWQYGIEANTMRFYVY